MWLWAFSAIVVYPVGAFSTLFGFPSVYTEWYSAVVLGGLKLSSAYP
jgi:hypothetical protein